MATSYSPVPSVEPSVTVPDRYEHIQTTPEMFGGAIARGLEQLGAGALKAGQFYGQVAADQATNNWETETNKLLYGDPDTGTQGLYQMQGQAAMEAGPRIIKQVQDLRDQLRGQMLTPEQQLNFDQNTRRMQFYILGEIGRHIDNESNRWADETEKQSENLHLSFISSHATDEDAVNNATADLMKTRLQKLSRTAGLNPSNDAINSTLLDARRDATTARIRALAPNNPTLAKQVFDQANALPEGGLFKGTPQYDALANMLEAHSSQAEGTAAYLRAQGQAVSPRGMPTPSGPPSDPRNMIPTIRQAAVKYGIDPNVAVKVAQSEGLGTFGGDGDASGNPTSFGAFQLHTAPGAMGADFRRDTGLDPADPKNEPATIDYALQRVAAGGWGPFHGAAKAGIGEREGLSGAPVRPASNTPAGALAPGVADIAEAQSNLATRYSNTLANLHNDPALANNPKALAWAEQKAEGDYRASKLALDSNMLATTERRNLLAGDFISRMMKGPLDPSIVTDISKAVDQGQMDYQTAGHLWNIYDQHARAQTRGDEAAKYGPGYTDVVRRMLLPKDDNQRISDPSQILEMAVPKADGTQDLTLAGVNELTSRLNAVQKDPNKAGDTVRFNHWLTYAKNQISLEADYGAYKVRDPKGEDRFNTGFVPSFMSFWEEAENKGKVTKEQIDNLIAPYKRGPQEDMHDKLHADVVETPGAQAGGARALPTTADLEKMDPDEMVNAVRLHPQLRSQAEAIAIRRRWIRAPTEAPLAVPGAAAIAPIPAPQ